MNLTAIALVISILGLLTSFVFVGILPSLVSFIMGVILLIRQEEKTINMVRVIAISFAGILLPVVMYLNTYGAALPDKGESASAVLLKILDTNYSGFGIDIFAAKEKEVSEPENYVLVSEKSETQDVKTDANTKAETEIPKTTQNTDADAAKERTDNKETGTDKEDTDTDITNDESIFESLDSIAPEDKNKGGIVSIAASDDDMPSYGGLPVGTIIVGQYFREDDHNCNPVLVLQNKTGDLCRYECRFIARSENGDELAVSDKTVEVVRDGSVFVFEGRFDKRDLGGKIPDSYEFSITKRDPYEKDMSGSVSVYTAIEGTSAVLTAENKSDLKVKVDAYVLFFDGNELVDCMWMIPQNTDEVCVEPGSMASIRGDAYYRFDRVETFYTAYEAVGE